MKKFCLSVALCLFISGCSNPVGKMGFDAKPTQMHNAPAYPVALSGNSALEEPEPEEIPEPLYTDPDPDILEISEKMFLAQINDIYFNFNDYKDKTIVVEGMFSSFTSRDGARKIPVVYRYGPGCCDNDGWGGFLLEYTGKLPHENDWIRVTGTPELITTPEGYTNLVLKVTSIEVKTKRGKETVAQ